MLKKELIITFLSAGNKMVDVYYPEYPLGGVVGTKERAAAAQCVGIFIHSLY